MDKGRLVLVGGIAAAVALVLSPQLHGEVRAAGQSKFETTACHIVCENLTSQEWKWTCVEVIDTPQCSVDEPLVDDACERAWPAGAVTNADEARTDVMAGDPFPADAHCWDRKPDYSDDDHAPQWVDACTEDPDLQLFDTQLGQNFTFGEGTYLEASGSWKVAASRQRCAGPDPDNPNKPDPAEFPCCTDESGGLSGALNFKISPPVIPPIRFGLSAELSNQGTWCKEATCGSEGKWLCDGEEEAHPHAGDNEAEHKSCSSKKFTSKVQADAVSIPVPMINWGIFTVTGRGQLSGGTRKVTTTRSGNNACAGCCDSGVNPDGYENGLNANLTGIAEAELDLKLFTLKAEADMFKGCVDWTDNVIPKCDGSTLNEDELDAYLGMICEIRFGNGNGATDVDQGICVGFGWFKTCWKWTPPDGNCLWNIGDPSSC